MYRHCSSCLITLLSVFGMNPKIKPSSLLLQHNLFYALMKRCIKATVPKSLAHINLLMLPKAFKNIFREKLPFGKHANVTINSYGDWCMKSRFLLLSLDLLWMNMLTFSVRCFLCSLVLLILIGIFVLQTKRCLCYTAENLYWETLRT